ncbi:MAG: 4-diphosphocytidyl-2-C-methyl-D-erythritol kinase [Marmoricola sp.]|nr:4-diphosphocytidyl-2-C-methyl-D-erythritol kinase [Marmoricola sp.]
MTLSTTLSVTVRAAAKVNLHLGVGRPRPDGFHPLATVYQTLSLHDDVTASTGPAWSVSLVCEDDIDRDAFPAGEDNIVVRAGRLLAAHHNVGLAAGLTVRKSIPIAGGLAGGSADAAATLVALDRLWDLQTSDADLLALAARLGSDVPFALVGGTALGGGRGELVTPAPDEGTRWWVVVPARTGLSTPAVYRHFDELCPDAPEEVTVPDDLVAALGDPDNRVLAAVLRNDLQPVAIDLRPELGELIEAGERAGALRGIVSGSGPTCLFLCSDRGSADRLRTTLLDAGHPRVLVALGPVSGTHVVEYS